MPHLYNFVERERHQRAFGCPCMYASIKKRQRGGSQPGREKGGGGVRGSERERIRDRGEERSCSSALSDYVHYVKHDVLHWGGASGPGGMI